MKRNGKRVVKYDSHPVFYVLLSCIRVATPFARAHIRVKWLWIPYIQLWPSEATGQFVRHISLPLPNHVSFSSFSLFSEMSIYRTSDSSAREARENDYGNLCMSAGLSQLMGWAWTRADALTAASIKRASRASFALYKPYADFSPLLAALWKTIAFEVLNGIDPDLYIHRKIDFLIFKIFLFLSLLLLYYLIFKII